MASILFAVDNAHQHLSDAAGHKPPQVDARAGGRMQKYSTQPRDTYRGARPGSRANAPCRWLLGTGIRGYNRGHALYGRAPVSQVGLVNYALATLNLGTAVAAGAVMGAAGAALGLCMGRPIDGALCGCFIGLVVGETPGYIVGGAIAYLMGSISLLSEAVACQVGGALAAKELQRVAKRR